MRRLPDESITPSPPPVAALTGNAAATRSSPCWAAPAPQQHRVAFIITFSDGTRLRLGAKPGYDLDRALTQCQIERDDPYAWLKDQLGSRYPTAAGATIIGVDLTTWPTS